LRARRAGSNAAGTKKEETIESGCLISRLCKRPICSAAVLLVVTAVGAVVFFLLPQAISNWQQRRLLASAKAFFEKGDLRSALISGRQLIQLNPNEGEAYPLLIAIGEQINSPQALTWASKFVELSHGDPQALCRLAMVGLKFGEVEIAQDALNRLPASSRQTADIFSLKAAIDVLAGRLADAESRFDRAAKLEPFNLSHRLNLLKVRMQLGDPVKAASARRELEDLTRNRSARMEALRALLQDARAQADPQRALDLARQLAEAPDSPVSDRLLLLEELQISVPDQFANAVANLQQTIQSTGKLGLIFQLMSWMNRHDLYRETLAWKEALPVNLTGNFPLQLAESEARIGIRDWTGLRMEIAGADWGGMNYLRLAIHARAKREVGFAEWKEQWESAVIATAGDWNALMELARLAERWDWNEEAAQTFWLIARKPQGQRVALKQLYRIYSNRRDTRELYKVAKRILQIDPGDLVAVNNVAALGLLLDQDAGEDTRLAEGLHAKASSVPAFETTYAFALLKSQQASEALQIVQKLPREATEDPSIGLYYGLVLAGNGKGEAAKPYLAAALRSDRLFPEEESLARNAVSP
jgi:tetratricopeptide (TPR) repeat protein